MFWSLVIMLLSSNNFQKSKDGVRVYLIETGLLVNYENILKSINSNNQVFFCVEKNDGSQVKLEKISLYSRTGHFITSTEPRTSMFNDYSTISEVGTYFEEYNISKIVFDMYYRKNKRGKEKKCLLILNTDGKVEIVEDNSEK